MKKKLFLTLVMALVFALALTIAAFAEVVHDESNVDYNEKVTLLDGTVLPLFDENKDALIWYISGTDENGNPIYTSILAEDDQVKWYTETWNEVTGMGINFDDGTKVENKNVVIVNLLDDDIVKNHGPGTAHYGKHITGFKFVFRGWSNLEYVYLRLDTGGFYKESFTNCSKLQYVNLEDLTQLERIGDNYNFAGCTSLFKGQVLDLSKTKLWSIDWNNSFTDVPMIGIKLPNTMTRLGDSFKNTALISFTLPEKITVLNSNMFYNCVDLETVTLSHGLTEKIAKNAFYGCTSLNTVYYVGTLEELNALLDRTEEGNEAFLAVAGENRENLISYADYQKLSDKSGKYMVYDYSWCEAYNDGNHETTPINNCVGNCNVCGNLIGKHAEEENLSVNIEYANYAQAGSKTVTCNNDGCTHNVTEAAPALFTLLGDSVFKAGNGGLVIAFIVNKEAVSAYSEITGKTLKYGLFVGSQSKLGNSDVIDESGNTPVGVISADMSNREFNVFELKIVGFESDALKSAKLAMGAYVAVTDTQGTKYSYMQPGTPNEGEKYYFTSYNDLIS